MEQNSQHLSDAQVERYGEPVSATEAAVKYRADGNEQIEKHLAECSLCVQRVLSSQRARLTLLTDPYVNSSPNPGILSLGPDCSSEESIRDVAAGLCPADKADTLIKHAAQCERCGPLLTMYAEDFSDDQVAEDHSILRKMKSSSPGWQKILSSQMQMNLTPAVPSGQRKAFFWRWMLIPAAVSACALIGFAFWYSQRETPEKVERLLAQAYAQHRTIELRVRGAGYSALQQRRSSDESRLDLPAPLLQAESIIRTQPSSSSGNDRWLAFRARADLLEWHYEPALKTLEHALELQPGNAGLQMDLATAYFERGEALDRPSDYGKAIDLLGQVLETRSDDTVALFNRAIAEEKLFMYSKATRDWNRYLQLDATGEWSREARERLDRIKKKTANRSRLSDSPLLEPEEFARAFETGDHAAIKAITARAEAYLDLATRAWLPGSCKDESNTAHLDRSRKLALSHLADVLRSTSGDMWLSDVQRAPNSGDFCNGVRALRDAINLNMAGDSTGALSKAESAASMFRNVGSEAGFLRATVEQVYALHRGVNGHRCLSAARGIESEIESRGYRWAQIQLYLEESSCYDLLAEYSQSEDRMNRALALARSAGFTALSLRAEGFMAEVELIKGNTAKSWLIHLQGLREYWDGGAPPMRAFQLYGGLSFIAEGAEQWYFERGLLNEALAAIRSDGNRANEALAHYRIGETFAVKDEDELASLEYRKASEILSTLPRSDVSTYYTVLDEIGSAKVEGKRNPEAARLRLEKARPYINTSDALTSLDFYRTIGEIELSQGRTEKAHSDLKAGSGFAESALSQLSMERDRTTWMRNADDVYRSLTELAFQEEDPKRALEVWEWYRGSALRAGTNRKESPAQNNTQLQSVESIISSTPHDEFVLIYAAFQHRLAIWVVNNGTVSSTTVKIDAAGLRNLTEQFTVLCSSPDSSIDLVQQQGKTLYGLLIAPVAAQLGDARHIVFELDKAIGPLPVSALVKPDGGYFGDAHDIIVSPGLMYRDRLRRPTPSSHWKQALVVGAPAIDSTPGSGLQPLPDAQEEAETVARNFPFSRVLMGRSATVSAISTALPEADLFHFAGHSAVEADSVKLLLAGRQWEGERTLPSALNPGRLPKGLFRKCSLAVLAACSTERSDTGWLNVDGMVLALLNSGVPDVIATRWNIDSAASSSFMDSFYASLRLGFTPSQALQISATRLRKNSQTAHPFYWAGFVDFSRS